MATWLRFKRDVDHTHASRAVTAYKKGDVAYVPAHIAEKLPADATEPAEKPDIKSSRIDMTDDTLNERIDADNG